MPRWSFDDASADIVAGAFWCAVRVTGVGGTAGPGAGRRLARRRLEQRAGDTGDRLKGVPTIVTRSVHDACAVESAWGISLPKSLWARHLGARMWKREVPSMPWHPRSEASCKQLRQSFTGRQLEQRGPPQQRSFQMPPSQRARHGRLSNVLSAAERVKRRRSAWQPEVPAVERKELRVGWAERGPGSHHAGG